MNTQLWYTTRKQVHNCSIDLCGHERFDDYLTRSFLHLIIPLHTFQNFVLISKTHHTRKSRRRTHLLSIP